MGKSPARWLKSFLFGKKSSKSKPKDVILQNCGGKGNVLLASKEVPAFDSSVDYQPLMSPSAPSVVDVCGVAAQLPDDGVTLSGKKGGDNAKEVINLGGSQEDPDQFLLEIAGTKVQAAFRGYRARCEFHMLKCIIQLQTLIRGHLVRRQAVAMLCCVEAIIKFQALVRGQQVRHSAIGIEVQSKCNLGKLQVSKCSSSSDLCKSTLAVNLKDNAFPQKLLAVPPSSRPVCLQYGPGESNAAWEWLNRWTVLHLLKLHLKMRKNANPNSQTNEPKKKSQTKGNGVQRVEGEQGRQKQTVQKLSSATGESGVSRMTSESEKPKRNPKRLTGTVEDLVKEHPKNELDKAKPNLRKTSGFTKEAGEGPKFNNGKQKPRISKTSIAAPEVSELRTDDTADKLKDVSVTTSKTSEVDADLMLAAGDDHVTPSRDHPDSELQHAENNEKVDDFKGINKQLNPNNHTSNDNQKTNQRRASFPPNNEHQENRVHRTLRVPSYMAPTESARAKLRGQGSPRLSEDEAEKNGTTRRHSLPSSTNGKLTSMSPQAEGLIQAASKRMIRSDRSLTSSRDGSVLDKLIKAEWRR